VDYYSHKHTNSSHQPPLLNLGLSILPTKGLSISSKDNTQNPNQTHYQLTNHLQSNALELNDKAQTLSYEHYYPYGGTAVVRFNRRADSIALIIINIVLCGVRFVCFIQFI
jgi:hypothetical protein